MTMNEERAPTLPLFGQFGAIPTSSSNRTMEQGLTAYRKGSGTGCQIGQVAHGPRLDPRYFPSLNQATYLVQYNGAPLGWWHAVTGWVVPRQPGYNGERYQHLLTDQLDAVGESYSNI